MMSSRQAIEEMNYHNDHRVIARERGPVEGFDEKAMTITHVIEECSCDKCSPPYHIAHASWVCALDNGKRDMRAKGWYVIGPDNYSEYLAPREGPVSPEYRYRGGGDVDRTFSPDLSGETAASERLYELNTAAERGPDWEPEPHVLVLRACYEVCPTCDGRGSHVNPDIDAGGICGDDDFWEDDRDDDWDYYDDDGECLGAPSQTSRYMRGDYDVSCYECGGKRVVPVPSEDNDADDLKLWHKRRRDDYAYAAERAAERMMGA